MRTCSMGSISALSPGHQIYVLWRGAALYGLHVLFCGGRPTTVHALVNGSGLRLSWLEGCASCGGCGPAGE